MSEENEVEITEEEKTEELIDTAEEVEEGSEEDIFGGSNVDEASRLMAEERIANAKKAKVSTAKASKVPAYGQGESQAKTREMLALAEETYGRKPTAEEIVAIKQAIHDGLEPDLPAPIPSKEEQIKAKITELLEENTRRDLETLGRDLGLEVTKQLYPNMEALAKAIVEKEFEEQ